METIISLDHSYSRHWSESYKTDHSHATPIHWILPSCRRNAHIKGIRAKGQHIPSPTNTTSSSDGSEDEIDVESLDEVMSPHMPGRSYDVQRARLSMNETQRFTSQMMLAEKLPGASMRSELDWEEYINKSSWSIQQNKLFTKVVKVLEDEKLARLAFKGVNNEPIARRLSLDRSTSCLRRIFAEFSWDHKLTQWLHTLLTSRLPANLLASYLDLIQTLRSKVPTLVERMIMQSSAEAGPGIPDTLSILLKRPWEPALVKYPLAPKQRLYSQPVILLIPNSPYAPSPTMAHRKRFWNTHLSQLGKVVVVASPERTEKMTILAYIEQLASIVRSKISLYQNRNPERSIVLVGWHTASILSCHISLVEKVAAVVCLGFPTKTLNGPRATLDDVFCDMTTPTLFIIGEEADSSDIDKIEDFREQLLTRCESHLLAVPGADDALRVSEKVKKKACVTQQMVDRMILDYVSHFFSETLIKNVESWHISEPVLDEDSTDLSVRSSSARRKRTESDELELAEIKRRRLSSATTAKISEILSGHSSGRGRDGARTPVQGVTYNLQTGSLSGLATVPNVLSRSLSKTNDPMQGLKTKGGARNKNQSRSITIDLAKDAASQIKFGKSSPDPSLLASGSQTEAAVATILGNDLPATEKLTPPPVKETKHPVKCEAQPVAASSSSAFTRVSDVGSAAALSPATTLTSTTTLDFASQYQASRPKPTYTNVKFNSTVMQKQTQSRADASFLSTINKQHWAGVLDSGKGAAVKKAEPPRKYPYLTPTSVENATLISSRSRKEERETMQATAILEQLTSGLGNDTDQSGQSATSQALSAATGYRRHSYDSTFLADGISRGRGRVRTRGGISPQSPLSREVQSKRRKTINEERPISTPKYYQRSKQTQPARYVVSSNVTAVTGNAAAKMASAKVLQTHAGVSHAAPAKTLTKPSILPVYAITQPATSSIKIQNLASTIAASKSAKTTPSAQVIAAAKKPSKVIVGQRLPVKFPGPVPGSSYTFVTIPALSGAPLPVAGQKVAQVTPKRLAPGQGKIRTSGIKYSVIPKGNITVTTTPVAKPNQPQAVGQLQTPVSLRTKAVPKPLATTAATSGTIPVFTSPSVVLHKIVNEPMAETGEGRPSGDSHPK